MRLTLLGYPLSHSLSPAMHNAALVAVGLNDWQYDILSIEPARLAEAIAIVRGADYAGANVTVPYKEAVIPLIDGLTPVAEAIGATNTLVKQEGRLIGHNTDAAGFLADLYAHDVHISNQPVVVIGSGGVARAVVAACAGVGAEIRVVALLRDQAQTLISILSSPDSIKIFEATAHDLERASRGVALVVNCTPLGMWPEVNASPWFDSVPFPPGAFVYDAVYNPAETLLTRQARAAGLRAATGLGMLVEQGALGFELWTGKTAPRSLMRQTAEQKLFTTETRSSQRKD